MFLGRPILFGLASGGQEGVEGVLQIVKNELENAMALIGAPKISDIKQGMADWSNIVKRNPKMLKNTSVKVVL